MLSMAGTCQSLLVLLLHLLDNLAHLEDGSGGAAGNKAPPPLQLGNLTRHKDKLGLE